MVPPPAGTLRVSGGSYDVRVTPLRYLWAFFPNTLIGLSLALLARATGGRVTVIDGVVEAQGGAVAWLLRHAVPLSTGASAITFGHVVLGRNQACLDLTRAHERVHVRQYERWGPLFLPAYGVSSLLVWRRGGDAYRGNRFEAEAFRLVPRRPAAPAAAGASAGGDPGVPPSTPDSRSPSIDRMSEPNPAGQHPDEPTFSDSATKTGNSRLWLPVLVVMLIFLIGAAILVLSGALGGAMTEDAAPNVGEQTVQPPGAG